MESLNFRGKSVLSVKIVAVGANFGRMADLRMKSPPRSHNNNTKTMSKSTLTLTSMSMSMSTSDVEVHVNVEVKPLTSLHQQ